MTLIHKPGEVVAFTPADQEALPKAKRITYHLRVPSLYDKIAYRRALGEQNAGQHGPLDLLRTLRRGVEQIMADSAEDQRGFILGLIDEQIASQEALGEAIRSKEIDPETEDGRAGIIARLNALGEAAAELREIEGLIARGYAPYRTMLGDNAVFWTIAGLEAARLFLDGCDGIKGFSRTRQGADEAFLARIPEAHVIAIAYRANALMTPSEADAKNSVSPSGSQSEAAISTVEKTQPRKARSKETAGI